MLDKKLLNSKKITSVEHESIQIVSLDTILNDTSPIPEDIISPRILTPRGLLVIGGIQKVGKSNFLLSLLTHLAAGKEFLGFKPPRPLQIFYLKAKFNYQYIQERVQQIKLPWEIIEKSRKNLYISSKTQICLRQDGIDKVVKHLKQLPIKPDIIAIDPLYKVFDSRECELNENDEISFFLQQSLELLRKKINPEVGIILVHDTTKVITKELEQDPFQILYEENILCHYYTAGTLLHRLNKEDNKYQLFFDIKNGNSIKPKFIAKSSRGWQELKKSVVKQTLQQKEESYV